MSNEQAPLPNIWMQPGTRLHMIVRSMHDLGDVSNWHTPHTIPDVAVWEIWTATDTRQGNSASWRGTFIRLHPDGSAWQVHRDPHGVETEFQIMPSN